MSGEFLLRVESEVLLHVVDGVEFALGALIYFIKSDRTWLGSGWKDWSGSHLNPRRRVCRSLRWRPAGRVWTSRWRTG